MDIAAMSMEMSQINLQNQVGASVLKLAMKSVENDSAQMSNAIRSLEPGKGSYLDATV